MLNNKSIFIVLLTASICCVGISLANAQEEDPNKLYNDILSALKIGECSKVKEMNERLIELTKEHIGKNKEFFELLDQRVKNCGGIVVPRTQNSGGGITIEAHRGRSGDQVPTNFKIDSFDRLQNKTIQWR